MQSSVEAQQCESGGGGGGRGVSQGYPAFPRHRCHVISSGTGHDLLACNLPKSSVFGNSLSQHVNALETSASGGAWCAGSRAVAPAQAYPTVNCWPRCQKALPKMMATTTV